MVKNINFLFAGCIQKFDCFCFSFSSLERCPSGYFAFRNDCFKMSDLCAVFDGANQQCSQMGAKLATPEDARENVFVSYLANQEQIFVGKTDRDDEGVWKRVGKLKTIDDFEFKIAQRDKSNHLHTVRQSILCTNCLSSLSDGSKLSS